MMIRMLSAENPTLAAQWDYEKNIEATPDTIGFCSSKIVWWKCANGHSWQSTVRNRTYGNGCPYCAGHRAVAGVNDLEYRFPDVATEWDYEKNAGRLPSEFTAKSKQKVWWKCSMRHSWQSVICNRTNKGNGCPYCSGREPIPGVNDLAIRFPQLANEWDYKKNQGLTPEMVTAKSSKRVWWLCKNGHSWAATVANRSNLNSGCPYCCGQKAIVGVNDFATAYPELLSEWDFEKNSGILPTEITKKTTRKYWWRCSAQHSWQTSTLTRIKGHGCPICRREQTASAAAKKKAASAAAKTAKLKDFAEIYVDIVAEWDYDKNAMLLPFGIHASSKDKYWWLCKRGHSWVDTPRNRIRGKGCPYCAELLVIPGETDLAAMYPNLAKEWDTERNSLPANEVLASSLKSHYWRCSKGHHWKSDIAARLNGAGCCICARKKAVSGVNDLCTTHPHLALEWDYEKNKDIRPENIYAGTTDYAWWRCSNGHSWYAQIRSRKTNGCPYCAGKFLLTGFNDLKTLKPGLALEWDYNKNENLLPDNVTAHSSNKAWWLCEKDHSWSAIIASRSNGSGCPYCAGKAILPGYNDLLTIAPKLAKEWDYVKNKDSKPESLAITSHIKVWWKCNHHHSWLASPAGRAKGTRCPYCAGKRPVKLKFVS